MDIENYMLAFKNKAGLCEETSTHIFVMNTSENQFGQTKQFFGQASPEVFASLNSDKEKYASLSDAFCFLGEGGMVRWNFSQPFEANVVPKYLQEIAGK